MCIGAAFSRSFAYARIAHREKRYGRKKFSVPATIVIMAHVRLHVRNHARIYEYRLTNIARIEQNETWFFGFLNYIIFVVTNFFYKGERKIKLFSYLEKYKVFDLIIEYLRLNISYRKYYIILNTNILSHYKAQKEKEILD